MGLCKRTVSGIMLVLLLMGMLTLAFDIHSVKAEPRVYSCQKTRSAVNSGTLEDDADMIEQRKDSAKSADSIILEFDFSLPHVKKGVIYDSAEMDGLPSYGAPGEPVLPFKMIKILIPQGKDVKSVDVTTDNIKLLEGKFEIEYGKTPIPTCSNAAITDYPNQTIYSSLDPFPGVKFSHMMKQHLRGYKILLLKLHPVQYIPRTGELSYLEKIMVRIELVKGETSPFFRNLQKDRILSSNVIENPNELETYINNAKVVKPSSLVNPLERYEYVIITNNALKSSFQPLVDWKKQKGLNASIVLVEDILNNSEYHCDGSFGDGCGCVKFNDAQAHIRNFIKDAYLNWGSEYVLLGGDIEIIPARIMWEDNSPDFMIPCDMYYGALDGSWNDDNDTAFGEVEWLYEAYEADFFAEVYVGRAPVNTACKAANFVEKTIKYEQNPDAPYLKKALMIGEFLDEITQGGNSKDLVTDIIPQYTTKRLYTRDGTFSGDAVIKEMNNGTHMVNHFGHASYHSVMGLSIYDVASLTNTEYFMVYSEGCYSAAFDVSDAIGEYFVTSDGGAFAYIGNSRYGWYCPGTTEGPGDIYDRSFFNVLDSGVRNLGKALQLSKENLFDEYFDPYTYFALNLLGDPETEIINEIVASTAHFETITDLLYPPRCEGIVDIRGTAKRGTTVGATFSNFTIEFGQGTSPTNWSSAGICLMNNGETEIVDGILATWNTGLPDKGTYTLKLTVWDTYGNVGEDWVVIFIPTHDVAITSVDPSVTEVYQSGIVDIFVVAKNQGTDTETFEISILLNDTTIITETILNLLWEESKTLTFNWDTTDVSPGNYTITAVASVVPNEIDVSNNNLTDETVSVKALPESMPCLEVVPIDVTTYGKTFRVDIMIKNLSLTWNLTGWEFMLWYDTSMLDVVNVTQGSFLQEFGSTFFVKRYGQDIWPPISDRTYEDGGLVLAGCTLLPPAVTPSGSGTLATITFDATGTGSSLLSLYHTKSPYPSVLVDVDAKHVPCDAVDGYVNTRREQIQGDSNGDGVVNIYDLIIWANAYGSQPGFPNWNPQANFVSDRVIDVFDGVIIAVNYGKTE